MRLRDFSLVELAEGKAKILVPDYCISIDRGLEATTSLPVFYNPNSKVSRDVTVIALRSLFGSTYGISLCDALAGTGVRAIRIALESCNVKHAIVNDINPNAYELVKENIKRNGLIGSAVAVREDANLLLPSLAWEGKVDYVDIDPFGSPCRFVENALRATKPKGVLGISATDTAPLCGTHPSSCIRKYDALPVKSYFSKEVACRILLGFIARTALRLNLSIDPLITFNFRHFIRTLVKVKRGKSSLSFIGFLRACEKCLRWESIQISKFSMSDRCDECGSKLKLAGPLWLGSMSSKELVYDSLSSAPTDGETYKHALKVLKLIAEEIDDVPFFYRVDVLGSMLKSSLPSPLAMVEKLIEMGYRASLTHIDPRGFRTDAPIDDIKRAFLSLNPS